MAYRHGDRHQMTLLPQSIEEYVAAEDPVRAYDAFVESLDFNTLGIAGNVLFVDGTKIRANASARRTHEKKWYQQQLKKVDRRIEQLLQECERIDQKE